MAGGGLGSLPGPILSLRRTDSFNAVYSAGRFLIVLGRRGRRAQGQDAEGNTDEKEEPGEVAAIIPIEVSASATAIADGVFMQKSVCAIA